MGCMYNTYSVLMSVYDKEKPEQFRQAMESMQRQTIPTDNFVLVCDGPLNPELDAVIAEKQREMDDALTVIRLEKNTGLGNALNEGIRYCKNELVARMDSDDISFADRCEKQLEVFAGQTDVDIVSGTILEFKKTTDEVTGKRMLPETQEEIRRFSHKRNPFNHPAVMVKKSKVNEAGGYRETYPLFEDYYLWVRMLQNGSRGYNIQEPVLFMRVSDDMYLRRGGSNYAKNMLAFHKWMKQTGWTTGAEYVTGAIPHALVCVMPNWLRLLVYRLMRA
jgi:glycosyltransferase involved in cell wall biosynthesis